MGAEGDGVDGMMGWEKMDGNICYAPAPSSLLWVRRGGKARIISAGHDNLFCFVCLFVCDFFFSFLFCLCVD